MSKEPFQSWIILDQGWILTAHCTCTGGLDQVCNHIAAIAFAVHFKTDPSSGTDLPTENMPPMKIKDMDWGVEKEPDEPSDDGNYDYFTEIITLYPIR